MKNKVTYVLIFLLTFHCRAQVKQFDLSKGNCQLFNGNLYCYGISSLKKSALFCIYKTDLKLKILDSLFIEPLKSSPGEYLQTWADTLHDYLNVYLQKKEKKTVTILRFNKKFELIATIENTEIARLNNTSLFSNEILYFKNSVYSIKTESDTSGKQFYLNKYTLKSEASNFDYIFKWQFPFERKNIHSAHVFYANKTHVFLFVTVYGGFKTGQWVLKIDAETGKLTKATKLNDKGENASYLFGDFCIDKNYKSVTLVGQKFADLQCNFHDNTLNVANAIFTTVYALEIDSLGEVITKQDFKIPINDIKTVKAGVKKDQGTYLLRINNLMRGADRGLCFAADIFKGFNQTCYFYSNTTLFNLIPAEDKLTLEKNAVKPNLQIEDYYLTADKLDMNGKLCNDSLNQLENTFYKPLTFPVKQQFKLDADKNSVWILSKHTSKKNTVNYSFLSPVKKTYQLTTIEDIIESNNPVFTCLSQETFIISSQTEEGKYQLKLYNW